MLIAISSLKRNAVKTALMVKVHVPRHCFRTLCVPARLILTFTGDRSVAIIKTPTTIRNSTTINDTLDFRNHK